MRLWTLSSLDSSLEDTRSPGRGRTRRPASPSTSHFVCSGSGPTRPESWPLHSLLQGDGTEWHPVPDGGPGAGRWPLKLFLQRFWVVYSFSEQQEKQRGDRQQLEKQKGDDGSPSGEGLRGGPPVAWHRWPSRLRGQAGAVLASVSPHPTLESRKVPPRSSPLFQGHTWMGKLRPQVLKAEAWPLLPQARPSGPAPSTSGRPALPH